MKRIARNTITLLLGILLTACTAIFPEATSEIENQTWVLVSVENNTPVSGHYPVLEMKDGEVSGNTGCNHYGGSYKIKQDTLRFEGLFSTEMACLEPDGLMIQETRFLQLLAEAQSYELSTDLLTINTENGSKLLFVTQDAFLAILPTQPVNEQPPAETQPAETTQPPAPQFTLLEGYQEYQDTAMGISIQIPESWAVTGVIEGQYAILQSYPPDKYIGGEAREPGDTKCDLSLITEGRLPQDILAQWETDDMTTILSAQEITLSSGENAFRVELNSMGPAISLLTQVGEKGVSLICFGDPQPFDPIANTIHGIPH
jgi:heat shock protein HslJ